MGVRIACLLVILLTVSCAKEKTYRIIVDKEGLSEFTGAELTARSRQCEENLHYAPDPENYAHYDERTVRINVHFMCSSDGSVGFSEKEGREYMYHLIKNANSRLKNNHKMNLPEGNDTPALQPFYQYELTPGNQKDDDAYYWHYDDELYYFVNKGKNRNNYDKDVIKKYEIGGDSILNLFIMPHHPDSVISKTYRPHGTGIALNNSLKMAGLYEHPDNPWGFATLLNHEIGHILGLRHSWSGNDGCDDTPRHPNCWQEDSNRDGCAGPISNNLMDYNNSQMAISPCQLGIIHKNFSKLRSRQRQYIMKDWCYLDSQRPIVIEKDLTWSGARDISRNIIIRSGATFRIQCRVSMPPGSEIMVEPGAKLILENARLHNDCDENWKGIKLLKKGKLKGGLESLGNVIIEDVELS